MSLSTWYLQGVESGQTERPASAPSFHVLCPKCGTIWAQCISEADSGWTCVHMPCQSCGRGTLTGADWMVHPYDPMRLPSKLLRREVLLAAEQGDKYAAIW